MEGFGTNLDIFMFVANNSCFSQPSVLFEVFVNAIDLSENEKKELKQFCQTYVCSLRNKWISCNRTRHTFIKKYETWLQENIKWPEVVSEKMTPSSVSVELQPCSSSDFSLHEGASSSTSYKPETCSTGTSTSIVSPRKPFTELSPLQKRRRVEDLLSHSTESLAFATGLSAGSKNVADIIKLVTEHPEEATKIKELLQSKKTVPIYSADKALGILTSLKLSKWQYIALRACAKEEGIPLYPSYDAIVEAKKDCYPPKDTIEITERGVRVKLQSILDKTVARLGKSLSLESSLDGKELKLICKWGFDGASGQSLYKQTIADEDDSSVFMCSFVPLRLVCGDEKIWENPKPSSTMLCRPLYFKFASENKLDILEEQGLIEAEIATLEPSIMGSHSVKHEMLMTMIDGKITSQLSKTSTQTCDICKATPSEMNNLEKISK